MRAKRAKSKAPWCIIETPAVSKLYYQNNNCIKMAFIEKVANPSYYIGQWSALKTSSANYYKPLIRAGR